MNKILLFVLLELLISSFDIGVMKILKCFKCLRLGLGFIKIERKKFKFWMFIIRYRSIKWWVCICMGKIIL